MRTERIGVRLFRAALHVLPPSLRKRAGEEMVEVFRQRHRRARGLGVARAWVREFGGVLGASARAWAGRSAAAAGGGLASRDGVLGQALRDGRYAVRSLARRPAFTLPATLVLGLGIAASTAMFSVVDAVLLRPPPYPEPEEVVSIYLTNPAFRHHPTLAAHAERGSFSFPEFEDLRRGADEVLEAVAVAAGPGSGILTGDGPPERIPMGRATPGLFSRVLRVTPLLGRTFTEADAATGAPVILLTEGLWKRRFGADPSMVGTRVLMGTSSYTVIGVLPGDVTRGPDLDVDAWSLVSGDRMRDSHGLTVLGRLREGVSPGRAAERLASVIRAADVGDEPHGHGVKAFPLDVEETRAVRGPLVLLSVAALDREAELAVRGALGAGRGRLVRQLLTESVVLGGSGAAVGIALTFAVTRALVWLAPADVPGIDAAAVDLRVLGVGIVLAVACGALLGLLPALRFSRTDLRSAMRAGGRNPSARGVRLQSAVVVGEVALATVLLVGAGLLGRTVLALDTVDPGFDLQNLLGARVVLPAGHLTEGLEDDGARLAVYDDLYRRVLDEVAALPGVEGVAITTNLPLSGDRSTVHVEPEGYEGEIVMAERRFVTANYFGVTGIPILDGRAFEPADDRFDVGGPIPAIVSAGLAARAWPEEPAVGRRLAFWGIETVVVGVAANVRDESVRVGSDLALYVPLRAGGASGGSLLIRTTGEPLPLVSAVRERIWRVDGGVAIPEVRPVAAYLAEQIAGQRYRARVVALFSVLAALFSLAGVYGVTARRVTARSRELGVRMALGANRRALMAHVLGGAAILAALGTLLGTLAALSLTRLIEGWLFGVGPYDLSTILSTASLLGAASVIAAAVPGMRAARVDPAEALRQG